MGIIFVDLIQKHIQLALIPFELYFCEREKSFPVGTISFIITAWASIWTVFKAWTIFWACDSVCVTVVVASININLTLAISNTVVVQIIAVTDAALNFFLIGLKTKWIREFY